MRDQDSVTSFDSKFSSKSVSIKCYAIDQEISHGSRIIAGLRTEYKKVI